MCISLKNWYPAQLEKGSQKKLHKCSKYYLERITDAINLKVDDIDLKSRLSDAVQLYSRKMLVNAFKNDFSFTSSPETDGMKNKLVFSNMYVDEFLELVQRGDI